MTHRFLLLSILLLPIVATAQTRIFAVGDSITRGAQAYPFSIENHPESAYRTMDESIPNNLRSYREHLHDMLANTSCNAEIKWVGDEEFVNRTPMQHAGRGGWRADHILGQIPSWLNQNNPDVMLLNVGTNDLIQGYSAVSTEQDIVGILNAVDTYETQTERTVPVFIGNMLPIVGWFASNDRNGNATSAETERTVLTEAIANLVQARKSAGDSIYMVDINDGFFVDQNNVTNCATGVSGNPENMMMTRCQAHLPPNSPDGIHPNVLGERFIAEQFFKGLDSHTSICGDNQTTGQLGITTSISSPSSHDVRLDADHTFTGSVQYPELVGLSSVLVYIRDRINRSWYSVANPAVLNNDSGSSVDWSYSASLPPGDYAVFVKATDNAGIASSRLARRFYITPEAPLPIATITSPALHDLTLSPGVQFSGTANDVGGSGLDNVLISITNRDTQSWYSVAEEASLQSNGGSGVSWNYTATLPAGNYAVYAKSVDNDGNISEWAGRRFTIDPGQ